MKRIKQIVGVGILGIYFPVVLAFVSTSKDEVVCGEIRTEISDSLSNAFISGKDLYDIALEKYPTILGRALNDLDTESMELFFEKHPAIQNCEVYYTLGGALHIKVKQNVPVVRVFDGDKSYYYDEEGEKMPVFNNHTAHVLVANGYVNRLMAKHDLLKMACFIHEDPFWEAQIEQLFINSKGEFVLVPRVGDHVVEFGEIDRMEEKFRNLKALYQNGWEAREWNLYNKVSLKYNGQVVCSKGN
jgi:cell division protein FtsQ